MTSRNINHHRFVFRKSNFSFIANTLSVQWDQECPFPGIRTVLL